MVFAGVMADAGCRSQSPIVGGARHVLPFARRNGRRSRIEADADARAGVQQMRIALIGLADAVENLAGHRRGVGGGGDMGQHHDKLVDTLIY